MHIFLSDCCLSRDFFCILKIGIKMIALANKIRTDEGYIQPRSVR